MDYSYGITRGRDEIRQFVLDTQTNIISEFNVKNMEVILKEDTELFTQFESLKKKAQTNSVFIYLRKFNEKHPLYLPVK